MKRVARAGCIACTHAFSFSVLLCLRVALPALGKIREAINLWNTIAEASPLRVNCEDPSTAPRRSCPDDTPARTVQKGLGWLESATSCERTAGMQFSPRAICAKR